MKGEWKTSMLGDFGSIVLITRHFNNLNDGIIDLINFLHIYIHACILYM